MKPCLPKWAAIRLPCATQDISISSPCHPSILDTCIITYQFISFDILGSYLCSWIQVSCDIMWYHYISRLMIWHDMTWYTMLFCTTWYQHDMTKNKIMIHRQQISCPVSCRVGIMSLYQWYRDMIPEWHDLGYEMTNKLYLYFYIMISLHIITYHYTCNGIM